MSALAGLLVDVVRRLLAAEGSLGVVCTAAEPRGLHRLHVVLTRAVSTLVVPHRGDLPAELTA